MPTIVIETGDKEWKIQSNVVRSLLMLGNVGTH
jgi:hypothetical protein